MNHMNPSVPALREAISRAGSQTALAKLIGRSQPLIHKWLKSRNPVRPENCLAIEEKVGVSRQWLRPDDWQRIWPELAEKERA